MSHPKIANTDHDILDVIRNRWSPRAFDPSRDVPAADLRRLFEAARWAPSSMNEQPWRFLVASRKCSPETFAALVESLTGKNPMWAGNAPAFILTVVRLTTERDESMNAHAWYDTGQAVGFLVLQATGLGLSIRQMEGFDHDRARRACNIPPPFEPAVLMAIGYAGDPETLQMERHRDAERQPRQRRPIEKFVFEGTWGKVF
ncbi:MAG TPA: nitroreductase family protein [Vicinamibacterales bacterium]